MQSSGHQEYLLSWDQEWLRCLGTWLILGRIQILSCVGFAIVGNWVARDSVPEWVCQLGDAPSQVQDQPMPEGTTSEITVPKINC